MLKILFVCHGNICRSPMAEFIFKKLAYERGADELFYVESRATSSEEIWNGKGNPVYPPAAAELEKHGINCKGKHAIQLTRSDYEEYDLLIGMDSANIKNMHRIIGKDTNGKIRKLLEYEGSSDDVVDPWYTGRFDIAYNDIRRGCIALIESLLRTV